MGNSDQNRNVGPRVTPRKPIKTQNLGCQTESQQTSGALLGSVSTATFSVILRDWLFLSLLLLFLPRMRTRRFRELRLGVESGDRPPGLGAVLPRLWPNTRGSRARILTQIGVEGGAEILHFQQAHREPGGHGAQSALGREKSHLRSE